MPRSLTLPALLIVSAASLAATALPARAQYFSNDIVAKCSQVVGQMKFEGWAADRNKEMMTLSCESNGGSIPGGYQSAPAALRGHESSKQP